MNSPFHDIGLLLLAAGSSSRFHSNKLASILLGMPLLRRTGSIYAALPFAHRVVTTSDANPTLADLDFSEVVLGRGCSQSASLSAGIAALAGEVRGVMIALADMPLVSVDHLRALAESFDGSRIVCSATEDFRSPPALFPLASLQELATCSGDHGARRLLRNAFTVAATSDVLHDVDTQEDLLAAEDFLRKGPIFSEISKLKIQKADF